MFPKGGAAAFRHTAVNTMAVIFLVMGLATTTAWGTEARQFKRVPAGQSNTDKGARQHDNTSPKTKAAPGDTLRHEIWGQTDYGEGYIFGPSNRRSGMTVVDIDRDGDNDFVFPGTGTNPQVMLNLGSSGAFYPGGSRELAVSPLPNGLTYDLGMDFIDLNGDGRKDLVAVLNQTNPARKHLAWFRNDGTPAGASLPGFTYQGLIYTSQRVDFLAGIWLTLGDLDADGDADLLVAEDFTDIAAPFHRIYLSLNTGTPQAPDFADAVEVPALTSLMPDRVPVDKALPKGATPGEPVRQKRSDSSKATAFLYNLGDISLTDWNHDGVLDFMYYQDDEGMKWIPNIGTAQAPVWSATVGNNGDPLYDHRSEDGRPFIEGTFAIEDNPEAAKPGAEWQYDVYLSVNSRLKTYRYFPSDDFYRVVQENPVAYPSGQGPAAFWDCDGDGDLDMFRMGISGAALTNLLLLPNEGTLYNPAWGQFRGIPSVPLNEGAEVNSWRNDLYQFDDWANTGGTPDFLVQGQDGRITRYSTALAPGQDAMPAFTQEEQDFGSVVAPDHTDIQPRGLAMADFDDYQDGFSEVLAAYGHKDGGNLVLVDTLLGEVHDVPDLLDAPEGGTLNPDRIEGLAVAYANGDSLPDLIVTLSETTDYRQCRHWVYENTSQDTFPYFKLTPAFELTSPFNTDNAYARTPTFTDIDGDGDDDMFVAHRYPPTSLTNFNAYLRYYRNTGDTGMFYVRFRSVSGQSVPMTLQLTTGGGSSTQLVTPEYQVILNNSGGFLMPQAQWLAGSNAPTVDILDTTNLQQGFGFPGEARAFVDVLPPVVAGESKAILIVGDTQTGDLYPTFATLASIGYLELKSEGLSKDNIRLYADGAVDGDFDGQNDVVGKPTLAAIQSAITGWAPGAKRVLVYLIDHGQRGRFRLNDTDFLEASTLDGWLDTLQAGNNTFVTTLIDTCESGSFIEPLKGRNRLTMASAGIGPIEGVALFDKTAGISFSLQFWIQMFNGKTFGQAFKEAKTSMEAINPLQHPQIDDDGDGKPNEVNDGLIADGLRAGANFKVRGPSVFIGEVAPNQTLNKNSATLWLADVVTPFPVEGAKAIIVPPNFNRPTADNNDEQPVSGLPSVLFSFNSTLNRWEGTFNDFSEGGLYQVQYFVKTGGQYYASPRIGFVDRIGIADAWESDDSPSAAPWLAVNQVQGHNFHRNGDEDWVRFSSPVGAATFAVLAPRPRCQAIVELYSESALKQGGAPIITQTAAAPGGEVVFTQSFAASEQYFLRVRNIDPGISGQDTSYLLLGAVGTGGLLSTALFVTALDDESGAVVPGAAVKFSGANAGQTSSDGIVQVVVPDYGNYAVTVSKEGYQDKTEQVSVNNSIESASIRLSKGQPVDPGKGGCAGCAPGQERPEYWLGDAFVIAAVVAAMVSSKRKRAER